VLRLSQPSYQALKRILERQAATKEASAAADKPTPLRQHGEHIRAIGEYQSFWDEYSRQAAAAPQADPSTHDQPR